PMMRNIIAITVLFSLIVTFANFDIVQIMTAGGPRNMTHMFATYAFLLGIRSGDLPLGAATSLFMFPILAVAAISILRGGGSRGRAIGWAPLPSPYRLQRRLDRACGAVDGGGCLRPFSF